MSLPDQRNGLNFSRRLTRFERGSEAVFPAGYKSVVRQAMEGGKHRHQGSRFGYDFTRVPTQLSGTSACVPQRWYAQLWIDGSQVAFPDRRDPLEREADSIAHYGMTAPANESGIREHIGKFLGFDFSGVQLHRESLQAEALGAHGFAQGRDMHLAPGRFRPDLALGRALIAHELTHVAQQGAATPRPVGPGHFRNAVSQLGAESSSTCLALRAEILKELRSDLAPVPLGMQQRCSAGCRSCSSEEERGDAVGSTQPATPPSTTPAATSTPQSIHAVGPSASAAGPKIVRLSWTVDDGPTPFTPGMSTTLSPRAATWFVMSNQLGTGATRTASLSQLVTRQTAGDEIGIHSMHPTVAHSAWFPINLGTVVPQGYTRTVDAMNDLTSFTTELRSSNLRVHFARMPGGELSEVKKYVEDQGGGTTSSESVASALLSGRTPVPAAPSVVATDVALVMSTLRRLSLHLWGGSATGPEVTRTTWEAESSGVPQRTNDVVRRFQGVVDNLASGRRTRPGSFIILAHDTTQADVTQAGTNIGQMERYATGRGVRVEYYRLADLYQLVRGTAP